MPEPVEAPVAEGMLTRLATAVTPATQEQWSIETLTTAGAPGTLTAETPGVLTASRKNCSNKSQLEHQGTPTAGTPPELLETPFTDVDQNRDASSSR